MSEDSDLETIEHLRRKVWNLEHPWRPIETAPKDGSWILLIDDLGECEVASWVGIFDDWRNTKRINTPLSREKAKITHWMPLPAPPHKVEG
jgi:hypothetical protein